MSRLISLSALLLAGACAQPTEATATEAKPEAAKPEAATPAATDKPEVAAAEAACPHGGIHAGGCDGAAAPVDPSKTHFGAEFAVDASMPLSEALASVGDDAVRVSGTVDAVCQKKGCWMVLADGDKNARILMKDHAFAVPMDCKGKKAEVEGILTAKTFSEAQVKHLEEDGGGDPKAVSGERKEYVISATGVKLLES